MTRVSWFLSLAIFLFDSVQSQAQDQIGIRGSNYGGIHSTVLNPAASQHYQNDWDANLVDFGLFLRNDYAFFEETGLLGLFSSSDIVSRPDLLPGSSSGATVLDYYINDEYFINTSAEVIGPSFLMHWDEKHAFGFISRLRLSSGSDNIPGSLGYYQYTGLTSNSPQPVSPTSFRAASWLELGINYANTSPTANGFRTLGVTAKYLRSMDVLTVESQSSVAFQKDSAFIEIELLNDVDVRYGFASSVLDGGDWGPEFTGGGLSLDLGVQWSIDHPNDKRPYLWRYGFSLNDIGWLQVNENQRVYDFVGGSGQTIDLDFYQNQFTDYSDAGALLDQLSIDLLGTANAGLVQDDISLILPVSFGFQLDRSLSDRLYLGLSAVQPIVLDELRQLRRSAVMYVHPRYESRLFEFSLPLSIVDYEDVLLGLSARFAFLQIGTNDIFGTLFSRDELNGANIYGAIRIQPFVKKKKTKSNFSNKGVKCSRIN